MASLNKYENASILQCHKCILGLHQSLSDLSLRPLHFPHSVREMGCQYFKP